MDVNLVTATSDVLAGRSHVILDVAAAQYAAWIDIFKSSKNFFSSAPGDMNDYVEPPAMAHAHHEFDRALLPALLEVTSGNDRITVVDADATRIDQPLDPLSRKQLAARRMAFAGRFRPAQRRQAEAERERRAKIVAAEGEYQAAVKLGQAADIITQHPVALQLRTLQTMAEISIEKNSTIIFPAQFMTTVQEALTTLQRDSQNK